MSFHFHDEKEMAASDSSESQLKNVEHFVKQEAVACQVSISLEIFMVWIKYVSNILDRHSFTTPNQVLFLCLMLSRILRRNNKICKTLR